MRIEVKGTKSVEAALLALREEYSSAAARRSVLPALRKAVKPALATIKPAVPVDTGKLRVHTRSGAKVSTGKDRKRKYHSKQSLAYGFVIVGLEYRDENGEYRPAAEAIEFGTAEQPAQPFIRANFQRAIPQMTNELGAELSASITAWSNKQNARRGKT